MRQHVVDLVRESLHGAVDIELGQNGLTPVRLPATAKAQFDSDWMRFASAQASGVRCEFRTAATWIEMTVVTTGLQLPWIAEEERPAVFSATVDGRPVGDVRTNGGSRLYLAYPGGPRFETGEPAVARFELGGTGLEERRVVVWLPQTDAVEIRDVRADAPLQPAEPLDKLRWWHHGSSISHCIEAETPRGVWPVAAADELGLDVTNLGFAANAHLDPFTARAMRDSGADLLSLKIGINIVGADTMKRRTFVPAVHGFLDTLRDGAPTAPILVISPIWCPALEDTPGPAVTDPDTGERRGTPSTTPDLFEPPLTLRSIREILREIVRARASEDPRLFYLDGLDLFGADDLAELPDGLHPSPVGYLRIAERFARSAVVSEWISAGQPDLASAVDADRRNHVSAPEGTFANPILSGDRPDPAVIKVGDEYWMTYSSFEAAPGLLLYRSPDLVNWTYESAALPDPIGSTFAVDIAEHDGRFFIYIPFIPTRWSDLTDASIFVIHAPAMSGPWSEPIDLGIRGAIDPGHVVGEDGKRYLFVSGVRRIQLADDGLSTVGELEHVYDGWRYPDEWITEAYALEGPKLFWRAGWLYLVSAVGGTAGPPTGHMVIVARSRSVHGPWENHPRNPIARTEDAAEAWWSRGHATLVPGPAGSAEDEWWMISHGYENGYRTLGRQILLEPIRWGEDGWPEAVIRDIGGPIEAPTGAVAQTPTPEVTDDFSQLELGRRWTFHAPSRGEAERVRVDGGLVLRSKGTSPADTSPLAMLTGDHAYEVEVELWLEPDVEAGLLLFFNNRLFCGMGINGERMLSYSGGIRTHWSEPAPATDRIALRIRNDQHIITGWYRVPGGEWTRHAIRYETSGYHANTVGDLLSLRPALYATGRGEARFLHFRYRSLDATRTSPTSPIARV